MRTSDYCNKRAYMLSNTQVIEIIFTKLSVPDMENSITTTTTKAYLRPITTLYYK